MNPEFQRNLWLEFSKQRLIAMPVILFALFFVAYLHGSYTSVLTGSCSILFLLLVVWGSGLTADAVFQEISDRTWETQRMTPLRPWSMVWGKLFGRSSFVWFGALGCLIAIIFSILQLDNISFNTETKHILSILLTGLFAQIFAFFLALLVQGISPSHSRAKVALIQISVIIVTSILFTFEFTPTSEMKMYSWYHLNVNADTFLMGTKLYFLLWGLIGIYRLLKNELQVQSYPWVWPLFIVSFALYCIGFIIGLEATEINKQGFYFLIAFITATSLTFLSAFFTPKNVVTIQRTKECLRNGQLKCFMTLLPPWVMGAFLVLLFGNIVIYSFSSSYEISVITSLLQKEPLLLPSSNLMIGFVLSFIAFLFRDIGILYFVTLNLHNKRGHLATLVYLLVLYTLVPMLSSFLPYAKYLIYAFSPWAWFLQSSFETSLSTLQAVSFIASVFVQTIIIWVLVIKRWQILSRQ